MLLHRSPALRRPQYFAYADWPGYTMLNSTMQSTKSGGPLAGAWAVVRVAGRRGLRAAHPRRLRGRATGSSPASTTSPSSSVVVPPDSTLVAFATDGSLRRVHALRRDGRTRAGTSSRRCRTPASRRRSTCRSAPRPSRHVDEFLAALTESVAAAVAAGPVVRRPGGRGVHRGPRPGRAHRRRLRRPARGLRPRRRRRRRRPGAPGADGRRQRDARPRLARGCARPCWSRSWTGCSGRTARVPRSSAVASSYLGGPCRQRAGAWPTYQPGEPTRETDAAACAWRAYGAVVPRRFGHVWPTARP